MEKLRMELAAKEKQNKMLEKDLKKLLKSQAKMQKQNDSERLKKLLEVLVAEVRVLLFGWFKRSLNQSIGSFSANPHFALFWPDRRSDTFGNVSNHWGMVTYTFFWNNFFGSLIRAHTGSFANVSAGTSPLYIKVGQISGLSKNGSWVLVDARRFFWLI